MQPVTFSLALVASIGVLALPLKYTLPIYVASLVWYPTYLAVSLGSLDFPASRIVMLAVLCKILTAPDLIKAFRWTWLDRFMILFIIAQCVSVSTHLAAWKLLEYRAGAAFDGILPYFAVRLLVCNRSRYVFLLKVLLVIAAPLAILGVYECLTGTNPLGFLRQYSFIMPTSGPRGLVERFGVWRGEATFGVSIMFGLFLTNVGALCTGAWYFVRQKRLFAAGLLLVVVGIGSSMSSGPFLAAIVAIGIMAIYPVRRYLKGIAVLFVIWLAAIDIGSNRHWYDVLGYYCTLNPLTAAYRIALVKVALGGGMTGHWVTGYGLRDPGWGPLLDGRRHTDLVNHYILILVRYGLVGLIPFLLVVAAAWSQVRAGLKKVRTTADRWLLWCLAASLAGMLIAVLSVSPSGQALTSLFLLLGVCGSAPQLVASGRRASPTVVAMARLHGVRP